MPKNQFIHVPNFGYMLISGPLFDWLTEQRLNKVSLAWSPLRTDKSSLTTHPIQQMRWELILFSDQKKQTKEAWRLEPNGDLPGQEALRYIEETF